MNTPRKMTDILTSTCQKLLKSVEICLSSDKNKSAQFFETQCTSSVQVIKNFMTFYKHKGNVHWSGE